MSRPAEYLPHGSDRAAAYALADDVTDEHSAAAITEAKAEGNLSRANVVRKVKGEIASHAFDPVRVGCELIATGAGRLPPAPRRYKPPSKRSR